MKQFLCVIALLFCGLNATLGREVDGLVGKIDALAEAALLGGSYPGLVISVRQGGQTLYEKGQGQADLEQRTDATPDTVFQIGSLTKSFTSILIAQLAVEEVIDLAAPVRDYLPDFSGPARDVPIRNLMNHTSGLRNYVHLPEYRDGPRRCMSKEEVLSLFEDSDLLFEPGAAFHYSNSGTYVLGLIIEAVTGKSYDVALKERVLEPLDLRRTYYGGWEAVIPGRAQGYTLGPEGLQNAPLLNPQVPFSAGALMSTVQDIQIYLDRVHRKNTLGDRVRDILYTQNELANGMSLDYALGGLIIREWEGCRKIGHLGDIDGFSAYMSYYPEEDVSMVLMANLRESVPSVVGLEQKIAREFFDIPQPEPSGVGLSADATAALAGNYDAGPIQIGIPRLGVVQTDAGHGLAFRFGGVQAEGPSIPLVHLGGRRFMAAHDDEMFFHFTPDSGRAAVLTVDWLGGSIPFYRTTR